MLPTHSHFACRLGWPGARRSLHIGRSVNPQRLWTKPSLLLLFPMSRQWSSIHLMVLHWCGCRGCCCSYCSCTSGSGPRAPVRDSRHGSRGDGLRGRSLPPGVARGLELGFGRVPPAAAEKRLEWISCRRGRWLIRRLLRIASRGSAPPKWIGDICPGTRVVSRTRRRDPALMEEVEGPKEGIGAMAHGGLRRTVGGRRVMSRC